MCGEGDIALKRMNKFRTLKMELFLLCAVAFIICLFFHAITSTVASELIDSYFSDRQNIEAIEKEISSRYKNMLQIKKSHLRK